MLTGDLLATTAEAYMSLGNVSYTRINEQYFHQAISYLRMATNVPGYSLSPHLQQSVSLYVYVRGTGADYIADISMTTAD
ncbi:hypothetical protein LTR39_005714 [Cryomyces antarcticus]|nr:hypothetical protein LTR39_005714 [Cryomyces antarcticus]